MDIDYYLQVETGLFVSQLTLNNYSPRYKDWLCNPAVNKYLVTKTAESDESVQEYIKKCIATPDTLLLGIYSNNQHIGNLCFSQMLPGDKAFVGYLIGETDAWGKGVATSAITAVTLDIASRFTLERIFAGVESENLASISVLQKSGFQHVGAVDHLLAMGIRQLYFMWSPQC